MLIPADKITEFHVTLECDQVHVTRRDDHFVLFAGTYSPEVDCICHSPMTDFEIVVEQAKMDNSSGVVQPARRLLRIMAMMPELKVHELAALVCKSKEWICKMLRIDPSINIERVSSSNAYVLSKLHDKSGLMRLAETTLAVEFVPICAARLKEEMAAKRAK